MKMTGADIVVNCLLEQGVDTIFGFPGGAVLNIYDSLYLNQDKITHVMTAHEQGATHAADAYARVSGKVGVVIATSGPGATNTITGLATAYMDSSPVVAITGNVGRSLLGKDSFQEVDIKEIARPVTKASFQIESMEQLAPTLRKAFEIATSGRKGPVLVDIPKDITMLSFEYEKMDISNVKSHEFDETSEYNNKINEIAKLVNNAKKPLIYAGGGVVNVKAHEELTQFARKIECPVCCSLMGIGGMSTTDPLYVGNIGMHGSYETGKATYNADLIITLGARFSDRVVGDARKLKEECKIVHVDIDKKEKDKNIETDIYIHGDVIDVLKDLIAVVDKKEHKQWIKQIKEWKDEVNKKSVSTDDIVTPDDIIDAINKYKKPEDIIVTDVGQHQMWVAQKGKFELPKTFITSGGLGTMGFGVGAAVGAKYAKKDVRVTLVTGDGSFHMNLNELVTLKSYNVPITVIIMNNTVLGMVRQWQKIFCENRFSSTDPKRQTDFVKMAKGFGIDGVIVEKSDDMEKALIKAYNSNEPFVIDCRISPDANVLPMIPPGKNVDDVILDLW